MMLGVPHLRQATDYTCGPACAAMILRYYGRKVVESDIQRIIRADPDDGASPQQLAHFFRNSARNRVKQRFGMGLDDLLREIERGWPVIVAYQDWAHRPSETNYAKTWDNGHYAVVVGFENDRLWFCDPSSRRKRRSILAEDFIERWRDITANGRTYHRWGLAVGPRRR